MPIALSNLLASDESKLAFPAAQDTHPTVKAMTKVVVSNLGFLKVVKGLKSLNMELSWRFVPLSSFQPQ
jgi:hypothetical protein